MPTCKIGSVSQKSVPPAKSKDGPIPSAKMFTENKKTITFANILNVSFINNFN